MALRVVVAAFGPLGQLAFAFVKASARTSAERRWKTSLPPARGTSRSGAPVRSWSRSRFPVKPRAMAAICSSIRIVTFDAG